MDKYADCRSLVRRTPYWVPSTQFLGPWGETFSYGLDFDAVYEFMKTIPYMGDD